MQECYVVNGKLFYSKEEAENYEKELKNLNQLDNEIRDLEKKIADLKAKRYNMTESYGWDTVLTALNKLFDEVIK